jgi:outer membrane receptor for ferrienterochelin and colicin
MPAILLVCLAACPAAALAAGGPAQDRAPGRSGGQLIVEVSDTSSGLLPGATVMIVGPLPGTASTELVTDTAGRVESGPLAPGRYEVRVAMPGFQSAAVDAVRVAAGDPTVQQVTLRIESYAEQVTVKPDVVDQRLSDNFTETLEPDEIDQLPDDPEEAATLIAELAGPDAEIRVNGFEDGEMPPKSQIQAIRIRQDPFAPDSRGAGQPRVEVITRPGTSGWEHNFNAGLRDESLDARNAFAHERGQGQTRRFRWSSSGPLVKDRTSLAFTISTNSAFDLQPIVGARPGAPPPSDVSRQNRGFSANIRLEHAIDAAQMLRVEYRGGNGERENLGVGGFSLPEHAYDNEDSMQRFRGSHIATLSPKAFNELRVEHTTGSNDRRSLSDDVTVVVDNAFTSGGAQLAGGTRSREIEVRDDFEVSVTERHKLRLGFEGEYTRVRSDLIENAGGRFTFPSLEAYLAGDPIQFTQRVGDPEIAYSAYEASWWVYDEARLRKNLQVGLGVRHDFQSFTDDWANFAPRVSLSWTPDAMPDTTVRAGAGVFNGRYDADLHEQTLRLDGTHQRDLIVSNPGWPDPFTNASGVELPPSVVRASPDLQLPSTRRVAVGVQHEINEALEVRLNLFDEATHDRLRSLDVNAPVDGERPDPSLGRVTEIRSIGRAERRGIDTRLRVRTGNFFGTMTYRWGHARNDADGPLSLPASSDDLAAEWGPASNDVEHSLFGYVRLRLPYGVAFGLSARASSGSPYTVRTGFDDNGDLVLNDRPVGVGRNTERGEWHSSADLRIGWTVGRRAPDSGGGGRRVDRGSELYAEINNLFNTVNFTGYSGVLTSRYFGQPTAALAARRIQFGLRVFF